MTRVLSISATVSSASHRRRGRFATRGCLALAALLAAAPAGTAAGVTLDDALDRVGRQMETFWSYFPSVTCTESVTQSKLGDKEKALFVRQQTFDYLIDLRSSGLDITIDESRVEKARTGSKAKMPLLETAGFSIFSLMFHPLYQSRYQFRQLTDDSSQNDGFLCISFQQVARDHPLSVLRLRDLEYPLEWRGEAWIDRKSWAVVRIQAGLGDTMADIGLLRLDADVTYSAVRLGDQAVYWLPDRAVIDARTKRQHWRNTHVFAGYKRFAVDTDVKISTPK